MLKKKSEESSKDILLDAETEGSTPDKSMAESGDSGQEVFDSFCMPEVDDFQMDFRQKIFSKINSDPTTMRNKYLNKLAQKRVWLVPSEKPKSHQTCVIFDWDDTLLCTSFLNPNGYANNDPVPSNYLGFLMKLEKVVFHILKEALKHGMVYIITNAAEGWVEFSSKKYLPRIHRFLSKITVISARTKYESEFPGKSYQWKMHAFLETMQELEKGAVTNLVAIGDSNIEMEASKHLAKKFPCALLKTVKLREVPTPEELIKQLMLINQRMENICTSVKNLTIRLEKKEGEARMVAPGQQPRSA
jgi:hypothetical protein